MVTSALTGKQQVFVDAYLISGDLDDAVSKAYDTKNTRQMKRSLLGSDRVVAALEAGRAKTVASTQFTRDSAVNRLIRIADDEEQPGAVRVTAIMGAAKILGFIVDKRELTGNLSVEYHAAIESLSLEQLRGLAYEKIQEHQLPPGNVKQVFDLATHEQSNLSLEEIP